MSKQSRLFKYNFTKKILHHDRLIDVTESTVSNQDLQFFVWNVTKHLKLKELNRCIKIGAIKFLLKNLKIKLYLAETPVIKT